VALIGVFTRFERLLNSVLSITLAMAVWFVMRRGHVWLAARLLVMGLSLLLAMVVPATGGVRATTYGGFVVVVMLAGLLIGWRAAITVATFASVLGATLLGAEALGMWHAPQPTASTSTYWIVFTVYFFMAAAVLTLALRILDGALRRARAELAERVAAEQKFRATDRELQSELDKQIALHKAARAISSSLHVDEVLGEICEQMAKAIDATSAYIARYDPTHAAYTVVAEYIGPQANEAERVSDLGVTYTAKDGALLFAESGAETFAIIHVDDVHLSRWARNNMLTYGGKSVLYVPLYVQGRLLGHTELWESRSKRRFANEEISFCQAISQQAANALENANLFEQLQNELAERKRAEEALRQLNVALEQRVRERTAQLEASNAHLQSLGRVKDEFVANVSHELRTPITNFKLHLSLLTLRPEKREAYLATLERETARLSNLIEGLLTLSRLEQERQTMNLVGLDLNALINEYVADRLLLAQNRGLALAFNAASELPAVQADASLLGQALSILLTNAINYTAAGGRVTVSTQLRQSGDGRWVGFAVSDTGPGIPPEERGQLFTRFFRGKSGRGSGIPGTGLGLAIVREIVDRHQGRIEVESEGVLGKGTTFTVRLPERSPQ